MGHLSTDINRQTTRFMTFFSVAEWPPYSPNLNPIEHMWGILVRRVYSHQRQLDDIESLSACIRDAWEEIRNETLDSLVTFMQKRCLEVVVSKGKKINY